MKATRLFRTLGVTTGLTVASMSLATAASAQPIREGGVFEETDIVDDFCDVAGLMVQVDSTIDARFMLIPHGPDGLGYGLEHFKITTVFTNLANGNAVTSEETSISKDLRVTDNGDGTLTILILATGNDVLYGADGKAIGRNPGQIRFEILLDHAGTPTDPSDDVFLADLGVVKGSTGRSDDFCETVVPALS